MQEQFTDVCPVCQREFTYTCSDNGAPDDQHWAAGTMVVFCGRARCLAKIMQKRNRGRYGTVPTADARPGDKELRLMVAGRLSVGEEREAYGAIPRALSGEVNKAREEIVAAFRVGALAQLQAAWVRWVSLRDDCGTKEGARAWFSDRSAALVWKLREESLKCFGAFPEGVQKALLAFIAQLETMAKDGPYGSLALKLMPGPLESSPFCRDLREEVASDTIARVAHAGDPT